MKQDRSSEIIRVAFIPTERDWLINLQSNGKSSSTIALGPASVDLCVLEMAQIVIFDVTAPNSLIHWIKESGRIGIQMIDPGDEVLSVAYFYLSSRIAVEVFMERIIAAYENRYGSRRVVGLVNAVGGSGLSEIAISLSEQIAKDGLSALLVDAAENPGDIAVRLGIHAFSAQENTGFNRIDPNANWWIQTLENRSLEGVHFESGLFCGGFDRVICDLGTRITPITAARLDDLIISSRPTPRGFQRTLDLARQYPGAVIVVNGVVTGLAKTALRVLAREFPGQVHRMPIVAQAQRYVWEGVPFADGDWITAIRALLPTSPSLVSRAA